MSDQLSTDMRANWYPISFSCDLKEGDVVGLHILGDPVCLYRERSSGKACVLADRCAHRSAPLSIGQLRDNQLECKYHGWKYDTEGRVSHIPALLSDRSIPANARVYAYPVEERQGMIWIWPGQPSLADPAAIPQLLPKVGYPYFHAVDMDLDHSLFVENLLDPAHLPFTHEGTLARRQDAGPLEMENIGIVDLELGNKKHRVMAGVCRYENRRSVVTKFHFLPPCTVILEHTMNGDESRKFVQTLVCMPRKPGHMRLLYMHSFSFLPPLHYLPGVKQFFDYRNLQIQFQDYELLHGQQARLQQGAKAWHTPIQVDGLPKMYRDWLKKAISRVYDHALNHDDYVCSLFSKGPYFRGWMPCASTSKTKESGVGDIEDLHPCQHDCSVPETSTLPAAIDDEWSIPRQRGVDNSAYTWRRDLQLGRGLGKSKWSWSALLISVGVVLAPLVGYYMVALKQ